MSPTDQDVHRDRFSPDPAVRARAELIRAQRYQRHAYGAMEKERPGSAPWQHAAFAQREAFQMMESARLVLAGIASGAGAAA